MFSDAEDTARATTATGGSPKKVARKKVAASKKVEPEPESDEEFDEELVEAQQVAFIPKSLRIDSPGRKVCASTCTHTHSRTCPRVHPFSSVSARTFSGTRCTRGPHVQRAGHMLWHCLLWQLHNRIPSVGLSRFE
jgi:hypothetical protein